MGVRTCDYYRISGDAGPAVWIDRAGGVGGVLGSEMLDCHGGRGSRPWRADRGLGFEVVVAWDQFV